NARNSPWNISASDRFVSLSSWMTASSNRTVTPPSPNRPQDAPIIHFDGPLNLRVDEAKFGPLELRRGETSELYAKVITPGLKATTVVLTHGPPDSAHPVIEIEWPAPATGEPALP